MTLRATLVTFFIGTASFFPGTTLLLAQGGSDWHREFPAFRIAGNIYYVGTADLASYLITTPQGHILLNANFKDDLPLIKKSVEQLGFKYGDIKIILISHAHWDHDEATDLVRKETGAKLMVMDADVAAVQSTAPGRPGAHVDRVLHDGDTVELGGSTLVAHLTPGHTKGCTTWTMQVRENGRALNVVVLGSANVNASDLVDNANYPQIADDYVKTFATLRRLPCDVFLGAHGGFFGLKAKHARLNAGAANPFIDPDGYKAYVTERNDRFLRERDRQEQDPGSSAR